MILTAISEEVIEFNPKQINNPELVSDYLWAFNFDDIDNEKLLDTCIEIGSYVESYFPVVPDTGIYACTTSYYNGEYNLFTFPDSELYKLYCNMSRHFYNVMRPGNYYMRCWVNLFKPGAYIDWHGHWSSEMQSYHGFYCVNVEGKNPSHTDYIIPGHSNQYRVLSKNGSCILGKSEGDRHKASPWNNDGYRVTIAFDVAPISRIRKDGPFTMSRLHDIIPLVKTA